MTGDGVILDHPFEPTPYWNLTKTQTSRISNSIYKIHGEDGQGNSWENYTVGIGNQRYIIKKQEENGKLSLNEYITFATTEKLSTIEGVWEEQESNWL